MPQPLDQISRFDPPEMSAAEEQRLSDWDRDVAGRDARVDYVIAKYCADWSDKDFLLLAKRALEECVDLRRSPIPLVAAYEAVDDECDRMHRMPEVRDGP